MKWQMNPCMGPLAQSSTTTKTFLPLSLIVSLMDPPQPHWRFLARRRSDLTSSFIRLSSRAPLTGALFVTYSFNQMPYFVFAEFGNEEVLRFLRQIRSALSQEALNSPIHVTLRGPYSSPPSIAQLEEFAAQLPGYGVKIGSHGCFSTGNGFAVFLRAECAVFPQLWHKPDFKVPLSRIQPHITLFESANREAAALVREFLRTENLLIHTYDLYLSVYESRVKQRDLFGMPPAVPKSKPLARDLWRIPAGIVDRANALGARLATSNA